MGGFPEFIDAFVGLDIETIRSKSIKFKRICSKEYENDAFFMTRTQFQETFSLSQILVYKIFALFDPLQHMQVMSTDVVGGIALASTAKQEMKVSLSMPQ